MNFVDDPDFLRALAYCDTDADGDCDGDGDGDATNKQGQTSEDALAALLHKSQGYPLEADMPLSFTSKQLRRVGTRVCPTPLESSSAIGGVYWLHKTTALALLQERGLDAAASIESVVPAPAKAKPTGKKKSANAKEERALKKNCDAFAAATRGIDPVFLRSPWFAQLWVQAKASDMNPTPSPGFPMWKQHVSPEKKDWLGVPRFFGLSHFGAPQKDVRTLGCPMAPDIVFDPHKRRPFRPEQEAAYTALLASLEECGGGFVVADCGFGKSGLIIRVLVEGIRSILKRNAGVRSAIVLTQIVLMTQMKYDIIGKPWTWSDLTPIPLDADGCVQLEPEADGPRKQAKKSTHTNTNTNKSKRKNKSHANDAPEPEPEAGDDDVRWQCPLTKTSLRHTLPADIVRAVCIPPPPLAIVATELALDATAAAVVVADDAETGNKRRRDDDKLKPKPKPRPGKCRRLVSRVGYQAWLALSAHERSARALDPALACPDCGGHMGGAAAWDVPSAPKEGWAPTARVGWLQGAYLDAKGRRSKTCIWEDCDIILVSAKSAVECDYPWASFNIGALGVDEAHKIASPTISQIVPRIAAKYGFGVSATPSRLDGAEHAIAWQLGPYAYVYQRTEAVTGKRGTVEVTQVLYRRGCHEEVFYRDGRLGFATMVNTLVLDAERNALILALAEAAAAAGRKKILIITSTLVHTAFLVRALREQCGFYDAAVLTGGAKTEAVSYAQNPMCRVVVATYHFLSEGYDDAYIDTMIFAAPRSSVQQALGRCERTMDGKLVPLVWDIVDTFSAFEGMARKRSVFYRSRAFVVTREEDADVWKRINRDLPIVAIDDIDAIDAKRGRSDMSDKSDKSTVSCMSAFDESCDFDEEEGGEGECVGFADSDLVTTDDNSNH